MESDDFHKMLPRDPILSQLNAVPAFTPNFFEDPFQHVSIKTKVLQVNLEVLWPLLYRFLANVECAFLTSPTRSDCLQLILDLSIPDVLGED